MRKEAPKNTHISYMSAWLWSTVNGIDSSRQCNYIIAAATNAHRTDSGHIMILKNWTFTICYGFIFCHFEICVVEDWKLYDRSLRSMLNIWICVRIFRWSMIVYMLNLIHVFNQKNHQKSSTGCTVSVTVHEHSIMVATSWNRNSSNSLKMCALK